MKKLLLRSFISITLSLFVVDVQAADLMDIYLEALESDPVFKEAYDSYMSSREAIPQARAALFPQVSVNAQAGRTINDNKLNHVHLNNVYDSTQWQVSASQALFNYEAWAMTKQAHASVKAAQATFNDSAQNLILRTSSAYFDILLAKDTLRFAEAKKRANKRQLDQAEQRFKVGLDAITSVYEAKAAYDQSIAEVISAKNNLINQNENMRKLTNHVYNSIAPLRNSRIPLIQPEPNSVDEWIDTGLKQNYLLYSQKYSLEAARENIKTQSAGSWPNFAVQGTAVQTHNRLAEATFFAPAKTTVAGIALAMNFPVVQGGLVQANTRQAQHDYQAAGERLEQQYRNVIVNSRIAYNTIIDGISKVKADRQTVISQKNSLESTEAQFEVGTRTMVDVVNAQQRLFDAQRQLASDQYGFINAILQLKYMAGTLNVNDIEQINSWLETTKVRGFAKNGMK